MYVCVQSFVLTFMALCSEDVSRVRLGRLTPCACVPLRWPRHTHVYSLRVRSIACLRDLREVFGVMFKLKGDPETTTVVASCLGLGYINHAKKVT